MKLLRLAGALLFFALVVSAQTADSGGNTATDPLIHVNVDLRQVDLIVTDKKGNHVTDLQPTDFELLEDGKPQPITNFSWVEVTPPPSGARLAALKEKPSLLEWYSGIPRFRKTPGNDILASPVANLKKEEIRRMISVVAGDTSVTALDRIRKFIDEQVGPGDMVSIRSVLRTVVPVGDGARLQIRDSAGIFQQFTNDKRQLDAATERLPRICTMEHMCIADAPAVLAAAIQSLQDLPGRKALLYVGRYRGPVDNLIALANRAGVVVYVLDTVGVVFESETIEGAVAPDSEQLLAERTGGRALLSTVGFDLTTSFNEVIEDLSGYYLLGYRPPDADSAPNPPDLHKRGPRKMEFHRKILVKVLRPGLTARVRDGALGVPNVGVRDNLARDPVAGPDFGPSSNTGAQPPEREETLTKALFSVFTQDGIRIRLDPMFGASNLNRKKKRTPVVRTLLDIDGRDLAFADVDGGDVKGGEVKGGKDGAQKTTVLDIALAVFNEEGDQVGAANKAFTLLVSKERAASLTKTSLQYTLDVALSKSGPYQVRAAVRDQTSGEIGSAYAFLDIPDFNQPKISLSSLVLRLPQGAQEVPPARPAWNEFPPGATVQYLCEVFGLKTPGKPPVPPNVETEVKLYRGGGPVSGIPPSPVKIENVGEQSFLSGSLRIPDDLAAGNYTMEVLAYDRLEPSTKRQATKQWIDVTVVSPQK
jgi:VWFA-related protein